MPLELHRMTQESVSGFADCSRPRIVQSIHKGCDRSREALQSTHWRNGLWQLRFVNSCSFSDATAFVPTKDTSPGTYLYLEE